MSLCVIKQRVQEYGGGEIYIHEFLTSALMDL
jgi:hypothetical protein